MKNLEDWTEKLEFSGTVRQFCMKKPGEKVRRNGMEKTIFEIL